MRWGTANFDSKRSAYRYYANQGETLEAFEDKLFDGSISIGYPELKAGETCGLDSDGRYWIEDHK
jgi:hypothetical protein